MAYTVTEAFYRLMEAKENLKVAQEALSQRQEFGKLTEAFYQAGKVTNLDHVRAQSQVSEAEQAVVEARQRHPAGPGNPGPHPGAGRAGPGGYQR